MTKQDKKDLKIFAIWTAPVSFVSGIVLWFFLHIAKVYIEWQWIAFNFMDMRVFSVGALGIGVAVVLIAVLSSLSND